MTFGQCLIPGTLSLAGYTTAATFLGLALLAFWVLQQDKFAGRPYFLTSLFGMLWWLFNAFMEVSNTDIGCKVFFGQMAWPGIAAVPIAWSVFIYIYCVGDAGRIAKPAIFVAVTAFTVISVAALTNDTHGLFYGSNTRVEMINGYSSVIYDHGPIFYISAAIIYLFLLAAILLVGFAAFRAPREQRPYLLMMLFGIFVPITVNIGYLFLGMTIFGFDPTPFAFAFILMLFTWSVFTDRMFDISVTARDILYYNTSDPIIVTNATGRFAGSNPAAKLLFPDLMRGVVISQPQLSEGIEALLSDAVVETEVHVEVIVRDQYFDARLIPIRRALSDARSPLGVVTLMTNVTDIRKKSAKLAVALARSNDQLGELTRMHDAAQRSALSDPLTGLGNRRALDLAFASVAEVANASDVVGIVDLDFFKQVNDQFGHSVGDEVLRQFAGELANALPAGALAFRVGGDEFMVLWPAHDVPDIVQLFQKLGQTLARRPLLRSDALASPTFSVGVAARPADADNFEDIYEIADARLYHAKRMGRNRLVHGPAFSSNDAAEPAVEIEHDGDTLKSAVVGRVILLGGPGAVGQPLLIAGDGRDERDALGRRRLSPIVRAVMRASGPQLSDAIHAALASLTSVCAADRAYVFRFDGNNRGLSSHAWAKDPTPEFKAYLRDLPVAVVDTWMFNFRIDEVIDISDASALHEADTIKSILDIHGVKALILLPLNDGNQLLGFIGFDAAQQRIPIGAAQLSLLRVASDVIALSLARNEATQDLNRLSQVAEVMNDLVVLLDKNQKIVWANRSFEYQTGYNIGEIIGKDYIDLVRGPDHDGSARDMYNDAVARCENVEGEALNRARDGEAYWTRFNVHPLLDQLGSVEGIVSVEAVITDRKSLDQNIEAHNEFLDSAIKTTASGVVAMSATGEVIYANDEARRLLELPSDTDQRDGVNRFVNKLEEIDGWPVAVEHLPWAEAIAKGTEVRDRHYAMKLEFGQRRILSINATPILPSPINAKIVLSINDITDVALRSAQLRQLASEDPLTGLANRRGMKEAALLELQNSAASGQPFALIMLDLDNFRSVNDMLRHELGDRVLKITADRLRSTMGARGFIARMGGDEFMILAPHLEKAAAIALAEELRAAIALPYDLAPHAINLTASVGIALHPVHGRELPDLISSADMALLAAKRTGRNACRVVSETLFHAEERRSTIAQALGGASLLESLVLYYQPQFDLSTEPSLTGAEALLRWQHPVLGEVGPAEFIPIAEETGVIHRIDYHVLEEATRQLGVWKSQGWSQRLSINMSGQSLTRAGFAELVLDKLAANGVDTQLLTIEITETMLVALSATAEHNVSMLKDRGVAIAIDDFGTGYASLTYLQRLDVTEIKIDRVFIEALEGDNSADSEELMRAIISMAKALNLVVTAEGVETELQRNWLRDAGCERIQGILTGRALTKQRFEELYVKQSSVLN